MQTRQAKAREIGNQNVYLQDITSALVVLSLNECLYPNAPCGQRSQCCDPNAMLTNRGNRNIGAVSTPTSETLC